ncbi:hypothetical protein MFIFM68171_08857 [Madurella fahalii]|uniref:Protein kinase domain-containing protein n=1 Tax=Madurella fahalii TaxID=1157608 RepID=A0ABQ0GLL0_9PEZI
MIGKGIQYGYVCTGEAFVFLHIPDDPSTVYFSVCIPNLDVVDDAQVFAFILQALRARPPPESWHDDAERLDIWAVEYEDVLRNIPETDRKRKKRRASPYKAQRWKGFKRSPILTRFCRPPRDANVNRPEDEDPPSPSPNPSGTGSRLIRTRSKGQGGRRRGGQQEQGQATKPNVQSRPFCTQQCLLGLAYGGPMDRNCPNADHHGQEHIDRLEFLRLIRHQLATDRGPDADCAPLHRSGARGSLFKVRLSTHSYTLVAKGIESFDRMYLQHENKIYDRLQAIQGKHIPVCLGSIDLVRPYHYDGGVYMHFMFLSWAGRPLSDCGNQADKTDIIRAVTTTFDAVHKLRVLHRDAEARNILYDSGSLMVVDFERAEFRGHQSLRSIAANGRDRKRKRRILQKQKKEDFARELNCALENVSSCLASGCSPNR